MVKSLFVVQNLIFKSNQISWLIKNIVNYDNNQ